MAVSRKIAGDIARAGDVPDLGPTLVKGIDTIDATVLGTDIFGLNHGTFATDTSILNDVNVLLTRSIRPPSDSTIKILGVPEDAPKWSQYLV